MSFVGSFFWGLTQKCANEQVILLSNFDVSFPKLVLFFVLFIRHFWGTIIHQLKKSLHNDSRAKNWASKYSDQEIRVSLKTSSF